MTYSGRRTQSFIVRIWFEQREIDHAAPELRGVLVSITTGDKHYFSSLVDLLQYIVFCLQQEDHFRENL